MAEKGHNVAQNYEEQGGGKLTIEGVLDIRLDKGGKIEVNGVDKTAALNSGSGVLNAIVALAANKKVAAGEATLDGSNPTPIVTGLATVTGAVVCLKTAVAPGVDPTQVTVDYGGIITAGTINVHAWKPTAVDDCTLIASTDSTIKVSWVAFGT